MTYPFDPGDPPFGDDNIIRGPGFFYRRQEILVDARDDDLVARRLPRGSRPDEVPDNLIGHVVRYRIPERPGVLAVVRNLLAAPVERRPRVGPHYVLVAGTGPIGAAPRLHVGPGGSPMVVTQSYPPAPSGTGAPITIAVIDTGLADTARQLPPLLGRISASGNDDDPVHLQPGGTDMALVAGHGTTVAGIIARHAPNATVLSLRSLGGDGTGQEVDIANKMVDAVHAGATIINLSLGTHGYLNTGPVSLKNILDTAVPNHISVVAAAGNTATNAFFYPAAFDRTLAVAALDTFASPAPVPASFTNRGPWVDACAPGVHIHSTYATGVWSHLGVKLQFTNGYVSWSGTSFATPHVTAWLAESSSASRPVRRVESDLRHRRPQGGDYGVEVIPPDHIVH